jgi:hypothetical protein
MDDFLVFGWSVEVDFDEGVRHSVLTGIGLGG